MGQHTSEAVCRELPDAFQGRGPREADPRDAGMDPVGLRGTHGRAILSDPCNRDHTEHHWEPKWPADCLTHLWLD
jgi:hypothetical protein